MAAALPHFHLNTVNTYERREDNFGVTNGRAGISITITPGKLYGKEVSTRLTPNQARELAADLLTRADEIDPDGVSTDG